VVPVAGNSGMEKLLVGDPQRKVKGLDRGGIVTGFRGALAWLKPCCKMARPGAWRTAERTRDALADSPRPPSFSAERLLQLVDLLDASTRQSLGEINRDESAACCGTWFGVSRAGASGLAAC